MIFARKQDEVAASFVQRESNAAQTPSQIFNAMCAPDPSVGEVSTPTLLEYRYRIHAAPLPSQGTRTRLSQIYTENSLRFLRPAAEVSMPRSDVYPPGRRMIRKQKSGFADEWFAMLLAGTKQ